METEGLIAATREIDKDQASLLLLFENCIVDHGGKVRPDTMSDDDHVQASEWRHEGFIDFGRIRMGDDLDVSIPDAVPSLWVELSDEAWAEAHRLRKERGLRVLANRNFEKVAR